MNPMLPLNLTEPRAAVLVVDDEPRSAESIARTLDDEFDVCTALCAEEALAHLARMPFAVVLSDQRMPVCNGVELLRQVREQWPDVVRIAISGYTDFQDLVAGVNQAGIYQFLLKPWQPEQLLLTVRNAVGLQRLQAEHDRLSMELRAAEPAVRRRIGERREALRSAFDLRRIVRAENSPMSAVCRLLERISVTDLPVLLWGESGTGKELLARAVHYGSERGERPFIVENCAALPDELLESELFGHKRGAFTGAYADRMGLFQEAHGGTLFLDEVGETSPAFQAKLLRVLQEGEIRPLGSTRRLAVDVRIVAATNRDLEADVRAGRFREDLYFRLAGISVRVPALRERPMDLPLIAREVLAAALRSSRGAARPARFSAGTLECLQRYRWPGNVRELQNEVQRMLALADGDVLGADLLGPRVLQAAADESDEHDLQLLAGIDGTLKERMEHLEARVLHECLIRNRWNKTRAATELGLSRVGLRGKLARYGLDRADESEADEGAATPAAAAATAPLQVDLPGAPAAPAVTDAPALPGRPVAAPPPRASVGTRLAAEPAA